MCVCVCLCVNLSFSVNYNAPRILKFSTNVGYDLLYCGKENWLAPAYSSIYLSIFLSLQSKFGICLKVFKTIFFQIGLFDEHLSDIYNFFFVL